MSKRKKLNRGFRAAWIAEFESNQNDKNNTTTQFQKNNTTTLSTIAHAEREFIWNWCQTRNLDDIFAVVALTYWIRAKAYLAVNFLLDPDSKKLNMVLCIHAAMKWLGYDEEHQCNFLADLVAVRRDMKPGLHQQMELDLLKTLNWEM